MSENVQPKGEIEVARHMYEAGKYVKLGQKSMTRDGIRKGD